MNDCLIDQIDRIDQKSKDIVSGYTKSNNKKQDSCSIPVEIIHLILIYFYQNFGFDEKYHGKGLEFAHEGQTVIQRGVGGGCCVLGSMIRECNVFKLKIKFRMYQCVFIMVGFITSSIQKSIKDWGTMLGYGENKEHSVGIAINTFGGFSLFKKGEMQQMYLLNKINVDDGALELSFNFHADLLTISQNDNVITYIPLNGQKEITPAFMLLGTCYIKIVSYSSS
eukprot:286197_1